MSNPSNGKIGYTQFSRDGGFKVTRNNFTFIGNAFHSGKHGQIHNRPPWISFLPILKGLYLFQSSPDKDEKRAGNFETVCHERLLHVTPRFFTHVIHSTLSSLEYVIKSLNIWVGYEKNSNLFLIAFDDFSRYNFKNKNYHLNVCILG